MSTKLIGELQEQLDQSCAVFANSDLTEAETQRLMARINDLEARIKLAKSNSSNGIGNFASFDGFQDSFKDSPPVNNSTQSLFAANTFGVSENQQSFPHHNNLPLPNIQQSPDTRASQQSVHHINIHPPSSVRNSSLFSPLSTRNRNSINVDTKPFNGSQHFNQSLVNGSSHSNSHSNLDSANNEIIEIDGFPSNITRNGNNASKQPFKANASNFQSHVAEVVELLDSDDEAPIPLQTTTTAPSRDTFVARPHSTLEANNTSLGKRLPSTGTASVSNGFDNSKRPRVNNTPSSNVLSVSIENAHATFLREIFPSLNKSQKHHVEMCIKLLTENRDKYSALYSSTDRRWHAIQSEINRLRTSPRDFTSNERLVGLNKDAKVNWDLKSLYSKFREYYTSTLIHLFGQRGYDYKKYHETLSENVKKAEEQRTIAVQRMRDSVIMGNSRSLPGASTLNRSQSTSSLTHTREMADSNRFHSAANFNHLQSTASLNRVHSAANLNGFHSAYSQIPESATASDSRRQSLFVPPLDFNQQSSETPPVSDIDRKEFEKLLDNINTEDDISPDERKGTPEGLAVNLLEHQKIGLTWLLHKEGTLMGGILADDMGLGKTIQMISLILSNPSTDPERKTTLIITPVALLKQWERELLTRIKPDFRLNVYIHHGSNRKHQDVDELKRYDIVLTTYGVIGKEHKEHFPSPDKTQSNETPQVQPTAGNSPFFQSSSQWYRIVLDEAQLIKNKNTVSAKACCALSARYRWCLSGTPMQNNVAELQSLIKFLRIKPYDNDQKFSKDISKPLENFSRGGSGGTRAMKMLQAVLKAIMLRRTKKTTIDGEPILKLPPKIVSIETYDIGEDEREYYTYLENGAILQMNKYLTENTIAKNYSNILVMLLRLRQACCHPKIVERAHLLKEQATLTARSGTAAVKAARKLSHDAVLRLKSRMAFECPLCCDATDRSDVVLFTCGHHVCSDCCAEHFQQSGDDVNSGYRCPSCSALIRDKDIFDYIVFDWVHVQHFSDDAIKLHRQMYRNSGSSVKMNSAAHTSQQSRSSINTKGLNNGKSTSDDDDEDDDDDDDDDDDIFSSKKDQKSKLKSSLKSEDSKDPIKPDTGFKPDPEGVVKPELNIDPKNKYSALPQTGITGEGMIGPPVPREDLVPCFPKGWVTSTKINECVKLIKDVQSLRPTEKVLIFSQFMSMLDFVEVALELEKDNICYGRYDGSMSAGKRNDTITAFTDDPDLTVLLISLKAGNVGLTLTAASHIIILDPFWNPYVEEQAMDRAHRIGQSREVHVHRLFIKESVEDRIFNLQEKKRALIQAALDEKEIRNTSRLNQNELLYLFGLNSRGQRTTQLPTP